MKQGSSNGGGGNHKEELSRANFDLHRRRHHAEVRLRAPRLGLVQPRFRVPNFDALRLKDSQEMNPIVDCIIALSVIAAATSIKRANLFLLNSFVDPITSLAPDF
jgi:hypothetical protein